MKTGGCQCGAVRYAIDEAQILTLYCCHCRECQRQSGSAFALSMKLPRAGFQLQRGELATWQRATDRGGTNRAHFCPGCGCRIYHDAGDEAAMVSLKAGTLDEATDFSPVGHIWIERGHDWVIPDPAAIAEPGQPDGYDALIEAWRGTP